MVLYLAGQLSRSNEFMKARILIQGRTYNEKMDLKIVLCSKDTCFFICETSQQSWRFL